MYFFFFCCYRAKADIAFPVSAGHCFRDTVWIKNTRDTSPEPILQKNWLILWTVWCYKPIRCILPKSSSNLAFSKEAEKFYRHIINIVLSLFFIITFKLMILFSSCKFSSCFSMLAPFLITVTSLLSINSVWKWTDSLFASLEMLQ